jgi:hypothetical protein
MWVIWSPRHLKFSRKMFLFSWARGALFGSDNADPQHLRCSFECTSGVFHWGALVNVASSIAELHSDDEAQFDTSPRVDEEGFLRRFRVRALRGAWNAVPYRVGKNLAGVIVHHQSVDPRVAVKKASDDESCLSRTAFDCAPSNVLFVESCQLGRTAPGCNIDALQKDEEIDDDDDNNGGLNLERREPWYDIGGLILLDDDASQEFINATVAAKSVSKGAIVCSNRAVGAHLPFDNVEDEYQQCWMGFNDLEELEWVVWDSSYHGLGNHEGYSDLPVVVEDEVIFTLQPRWKRQEAKEALLDPDYNSDDLEEEEEEEDEEEEDDEEGDDADDVSTYNILDPFVGDVSSVRTMTLCLPSFQRFTYVQVPPQEELAVDLSLAYKCVFATQLFCSNASARDVFLLASQLPQLRVFHAQGLHGTSAMDYVPLWIAPCKALKRLMIDQGNLDGDSCSTVAEFAHRCGLIELDLSNHRKIGSDGAVCLLNSLAESRSLQMLSLRNCAQMTQEVFVALDHFICSTRTVQMLDVDIGILYDFNRDYKQEHLMLQCIEHAMESNWSIQHVRLFLPTPRMEELCARARQATDACRDACIEFLLCRKQIGLIKPIASLIAQFIWSTRGSGKWERK